MITWNIENDLSQIAASTQIEWKDLKNSNLLITGGTGFIGHWLIRSLLYANDEFSLNINITVPSRSPEIFIKNNEHLLANGNLNLVSLDITKETLSGEFTHIIHAAADASTSLKKENSISTFNTIVHGTENTLKLAASLSSAKVIFLSSGAVYGQQPADLLTISENWTGASNPITPKNIYGEAKRAAEMLCAIYREALDVNVITARVFSLLGPFLALDTHFAAGNFIRDALAGEKIIVQGDGCAIRSYLYPSDLIVWLLALLTGSPRENTYNIGSEHTISIAKLAQLVSQLVGRNGYKILNLNDKGWNPGRYVPDTSLIRNEFNLKETRSLEYAILSTAAANTALLSSCRR